MPIIEGFTEASTRRSAAPIEGFTPTFISPPSRGSTTRNPLQFANDTIVTGVNSALGIGKAVSDFISVDNPVSRGLQYVIDEGEKTYSDSVRQAREDRSRAIDAGGWDAVGGVGRYVLENPLQTVAEIGGNFGPFGVAIKGTKALASAAGLGQKGVARSGVGAGVVLGGAAAGGDAAGDAYEQVMRSPNIDPAVKEELARRAAREASVVPALVGGATGALGIERILAGTRGLRNAPVLRTGLYEATQEGLEEAITKGSANLAAGQYDPTIDPMKGVVGSAAMGAVMGGGTGLGVGYLNNRAVESDLLRRDKAIADAERARQEQLAPILGMIRPDSGLGTQEVIDQQLGISPALAAKELEKQRKAREADITAAFDEPSGVRVAGEDGNERELSAIEASLLAQGLPTTPTAAPAPPPASKVYSAEEQELIGMGVAPTGKSLELLTEIKASGLPMESLTPVVTAMAERKNGQAKKLLAQAIIESKKAPAPVASAAPAAPTPTVAPTPAGGLRVVKGTPPTAAPTPSVAQAPGVTSLPVLEAPADVQAPQAVQAEAQGEAPLAATAAQGAAPAAPAEPVTDAPASEAQPTVDAEIAAQPQAGAPTEPVVQRKRRVVNPAALAQSQAFVAPEPVAEEEQTAEATDETDWEDSKPDGAPALAALTPSLQQVWSEARAAKAQGRRVNLFKVAEDIAAEQGDEAAEDDTLTTLNQIFGERDAAMLYDRYVENMTEEAIANKYGQSRQNVAKVTGEGALGQKTRAARIKGAQKKFGWTDDYVAQLAAKLSPAQGATEADTPTSGRTDVDLEATESAFGADTAPETGGRDPSLRDAGFSTSASLGGSVSNWRDSGELAGRENITQADQKKLDDLYARRAAAEEQGDDAAVESADAEISQVETKYLSPSEVAAKITQKATDLRDKAAKRAEQIAQARAAGKSEVSVNNKLVPIEQLEQDAEELRAKAQAEIERAEGVLQRGAVRKAKGMGAPVAKPADPAPARELSEDLKAAKAKFKAAGLDVTKMEPDELQLLRGEAERFKNQALISKIDARLRDVGVEVPSPAAAPAPTPAAAPAPAPAPAQEPKVRVVKKAEAAAPAPAAPVGKILTPTEQAGRAWDQAANTIPGAPKWADLPAAARKEFVAFGESNWTRQDVVTLMQRSAGAGSSAKFGKAKGAGAVKNGYTANELIDEIKKFIRADVLGRKLVIVDTIGDLLTSSDRTKKVLGAKMALEGAYGVASDGVAYLVADRIAKGSGRAKFMHEVGGHLGLENLLPKAVYDKLVDQIISWAKQDNGSTESKIAMDAVERVMNAGTPKEDRRSEILAYFLEEAVQQGIDPTADTVRGSSALREWFRTLWAAFKVAARRLGMKPESMTAQDIVNLAFGAARLEIAGTWHGTAAEKKAEFASLEFREIAARERAKGNSVIASLMDHDVTLPFRKFDHKFMGSGEGRQAFGWGTYLAQRSEIGQDYFFADVFRKYVRNIMDAHGGKVIDQDIQDPVTMDPISIKVRGRMIDLTAGTEVTEDVAKALAVAGETYGVDYFAVTGAGPATFSSLKPDGSLMRVDTAVADDELLDWDKSLGQQSEAIRGAVASYEKANGGGVFPSGPNSWKPIETGSDFYMRLEMDMGSAKAASEYLDSIGIKGIKFLDGLSRNAAKKDVFDYPGKEDLVNAYDEISQETAVNYNMADFKDFVTDIETAKSIPILVKILKIDPKYIDVINAYLDWKKSEPDLTRNLVIFNDKNIFRVGAQVAGDKQRMRFGKNPTQRLPAELQKPVSTITNTLRDVGNTALNLLTFTEDVINRAVDLGVKSANDLRRVYQERAALTGKLEREVERVADLYNRVPEAERGTGPRSVNQYLYDATREGTWGFKPDWRKGTSANVKIDADMKQRFDALSKESKALVRAVFTHGDEVLSLKKQTVINATNSEYDVLIAAAQKANDAKKAARLTADKTDQLKRFTSLFALQEFKPYAPLKRFGDYVVIARSQKYLDADEKTQAKLENSGDDYHVSFAESAAEARELVAQLQKQGAFADVVFRQKEAVQQTMFGGMLSAFNKLRSELDSELADAAPGEKNAVRAARKVVGELYLSSLAEASARKSEMRRRGVAGEIDMLRSFTSQGRADAQFIAGAKFNNQTLDVFNAMRKEVKSGDAETQNTKSGVFNELMKRHTQSMDYDPTPIASKLARLSSIWFLATSPAYYFQNLTQPFMMSMPIMAGRHNYLKVGNALVKAYMDLAPMFKTAKLGEQFNYAAAPQDVRAAISKLVDRGRIDIGMDTDLGEFRLEGEGPVKDRWNKVDRGIRNVAQKLEAVNRLSTAIAAYRMELAKTGNADAALEYADSIITQTHGDYTAGNAPRAFNTATGKVALQFRKFQLIQLTLLAKLVKNSFSGQEQAAARKALGFLLGHTAVMAGAIGLPGFAAISWALGALMGGGDDEPFNTEQALREWIGNEQVAALITRGVPAALGVDLSQKLGAGNVLSLLPFNDLDLSSRAGLESAAFAAFGGPAGGLTLRAADGINLIRDGQYYRGVEQLVPTGVTNAMKSYRQATEGLTRRNGDELISPDEISGMDTFWQAIGFQPTQLAERQFRDRVKREADDKFQGKAEKIRNAYLRAKDDPDARAEARERWTALQDAREEAGYRRQPLSSLMRAEQNQRERERNTLGGIQFNRDTRRFVEELVEE
jgi:hypothetical protein